jgi:hypothetical protein
MPIIRNKKTEEKKKETKRSSPFKDINLLEKEIKDFVNKFKATVSNHSKRVSDYFEMSCYNNVVRFYYLKGYEITIQNLQANEYRYKCSTSGIQSNFSHFRATISHDNKLEEFEIHHNLAVQSSHNVELFTTPDITIIKKGAVQTTTGYYESKKRFSFVMNDQMMSFCECKQFNPFPELLFNFIGVINELRQEIMTNTFEKITPAQLAPSLMISGKPSKQAALIKDSLQQRYCINIIYDLFYSSTLTFAKRNINVLRIAGKLERNAKEV